MNALTAICVALTFVTSLYGCYLIITSVKAHWGEALCPNCGYDMRGSSPAKAVCPECGTQMQRSQYGFIERRFGRACIGWAVLVGAFVFLIAAFFVSKI